MLKEKLEKWQDQKLAMLIHRAIQLRNSCLEDWIEQQSPIASEHY